jgi:acetyl esterase
MSRRADELHPQLQEIEAGRRARTVPESFAVTVETARADMERRLGDIGDYIDDEAEEVREFEIDGPGGPLPIRSYHPAGDGAHPIVVFYHGGGFVIGNIETHDNLGHAICERAGALVLSVDYRLAPEHPFPAAVNDAYAALEWAAANGDQIGGDTEQIAVAGDSAGGNLAAAVSIMARERDGPEIGRQSLIYPWLDPAGRFDLASYDENAREYEGGEGYLYEKYAQDEVHAGNQYLAPLIAKDLSDLPAATIIVGGYDRLRDEGFEFAERLEDAGVAANLVNYPAMNHGFASLLGIVDQADDAMAELVGDLSETFG